MRSKQLHHGALDRLGREIVDGVRDVGSVVTLADLEGLFGISRTVARETMRVLESLGMVQSRRRVGIIVRPRAEWNLLDQRVVQWRLDGLDADQVVLELAELRGAVEPCAAALAAVYATPAEADRLIALAEELAARFRAGETGEAAYAEADLAFHTLLMRAGRNEMFAVAAEILRPVRHTAEHLQAEAANAGDPTLLHQLAAAVAAGDSEAARALSRRHVDGVLAAVGAGVFGQRPTLQERVGALAAG